MKLIPIEEQARHTAAEAQKTATQSERNAANIDYIAMMSDIDLESEDEKVNDDEA